MGNQSNQKKTKNLSWKETLIIMGCSFFFGLWPVGIAVFVAKIAQENRREMRDEVMTGNTTKTERNWTAQTTRTEQEKKTTTTKQNDTETKKTGTVVDKVKNAWEEKAKSAKVRSTFLKVLGGVFAFLTFVFLVDVVDSLQWGLMYSLSDLVTTASFGAASLFSFISGANVEKKKDRYLRYIAIIGHRDSVSIQEIAETTGLSTSAVEKDLHHMLSDGYFPEGAFIDVGRAILFMSAAASMNYRENEKREKAKTAAVPKEANEGYSGMLRQIRRANDEIADEVLSKKIDRLEELTAKILRIVEEKPERERETRTFLDYYVPTTQKLLDSYAKFEAAGVEGENLKEAKRKINQTMDAIIEGFEHQLDELYSADVMDVDQEIRVMESMLRRDTASVEKDFFSGGTAVQTAPKEEE